MRRNLVDILACPLCKGPLELVVDREEGEEVITGRLTCHACHETYSIEDSIPSLLPPHVQS